MPKGTIKRIRTMRDIKSSLDISRKVSSVGEDQLYRELITNLENSPEEALKLKIMIRKERIRFASQMVSVERSREGMRKMQKKLAGIIMRNRELMRVRRELQESMWNGDNTPPSDYDTRKNTFKADSKEDNKPSHIEMEY